MRARRRRGTLRVSAEDPDFNRALEAMTAPELRTFVRGVLDALDPDARTEIVDPLMARFQDIVFHVERGDALDILETRTQAVRRPAHLRRPTR